MQAFEPLWIIFGLILLFFGRRLFWFVVAVAGFGAGIALALQWLELWSQAMTIAIAVLGGVLGALLSIFIQRLAVAFAGGVAGAYVGSELAKAVAPAEWAWLGMVIGGVLGALLLLFVFEWALIALSVTVGALLISASISLPDDQRFILFLSAFALGLTAQLLQLFRSRKSAERVERRET